MDKSVVSLIRWVMGRMAWVYVLVLLFCLVCVDFKMLDMRIKMRHLNDAIPDFTSMVVFARNPEAAPAIDWKPYQRYFELILRYMPDDPIARQLLGYVEYYEGHQDKAVDLIQGASLVNGHDLLWADYNLGVIDFKKGMWPQAAESLLKCVLASPKLTEILMENSTVYRQILINPYINTPSLTQGTSQAQSEACVLLLSSLLKMKRYDQVLVISDMALQSRNLVNKDAYYYYAGLALYAMGQPQKAYLLFQRSLTIEKNNPDVYYYLASIYENMGQLAQAKAFLQASYALHEKHDPRFPYDARLKLRFD